MSKLKNLKLITGGFIIGAIFFSGVSFASNNAIKLNAFFGVKLIQNGIDKTPTDKKPFIVDGSTYVPLRTVSELTGTRTSYNANICWMSLLNKAKSLLPKANEIK